MARLWKTVPALLLALVLAVAAACSGGGDNGSTDDSGRGSDSPAAEQDQTRSDGSFGGMSGDASEPLVVNASEVFGPSVQTFQEDVQSVRSEFTMTMGADGISFDVDGEMSFKAPDQGYFSMSFSGEGIDAVDLSALGTFEFLALGDTFYMNMPIFGGWFVATADDLDATGQGFGDIFEQGSVIDYESLVDAFDADVEDFGEEEKDGGTYRHYRVTLDLTALFAELSDTLSESGDFGFEDVPLDLASSPMVMDIWVHPDSQLPYLMETELESSAAGQAFSMEMVMRFFDYNEDFSLPDPPEDAKPFEELFGGLFEGGFDEEFDFDFDLETE